MFQKVKSLFKKKHKYTTVFAATNLKVYNPDEQDKFIARASYENVKKYLPDIDFEKNYDLLGVSFGGYISSRANLNGQIVSGRCAKNLAPLFVHKFIDIDHSRATRVRGVITNYAFADVITEAPLTDEEVEDRISREAPFLVCFGGVIWRLVDEDFALALEKRNDPFSDYTPIRASWECIFSEFTIAEGSKNLSEARIISDPKEIEDIHQCLTHFSGNGINPKNSKEIYLLLGDDSLSLGMGLVLNPAQPLLQSVYVNSPQAQASDDEEESMATIIPNKEDKSAKTDETTFSPTDSPIAETAFKVTCAGCNTSFDYNGVAEINMGNAKCPHCGVTVDQTGKVYNNESDETKFGPTNFPIVEMAFQDTPKELAASVNEKNDEEQKKLEKNLEVGVIQEHLALSAQETNINITSMKLTEITQLTDESLTKGEVTASAITTFFSEKLKEAGEQFAAEKLEKESALAKTLEEKTALTSEVETLKVAALAVQAELDKVKADVIASEKAETFNTRLLALAEDFELDDSQKEVVAEEIKDLDAPAFDKYLTKLSAFAKKKVARVVEKVEEDKEKKGKEVMASLQVDKDQVIPPNASSPLETVQAKWAKVFTNVEIKK